MRVAVTELFRADAERPIGRSGFGPGMWIGQALHTRHQRSESTRDPSYRAEVPLGADFERGGWSIELRGRADALRDAPDGATCVEELKSVWPDTSPSPAVRESWRRQVLVYAWLLWRQHERPVQARIVTLPIGDAGSESEDVSFEPAEVEALVEAALEDWVRRADAEAERQRARRAAAEVVAWPHADWRPGQREVAEAVTGALASREHLLVHAPTGLGKTVAALVPALRFALHENLRLFVLTATGLGQRAVVETLRQIAPADLPIAVQLRARAGMCANDVLLCHEATCAHAAGHAAATRDGSLARACFADDVIAEPDHVFDVGSSAGACPFELSLDAAVEAPVVVGDLNYVFDPADRLLDPAGTELSRTVLLVDEVHRLAPRVRDSLGAELDARRLAGAAERAGFGGAPVHAEQARLLRALAERVATGVEEATGGALEPLEASGGPTDFEVPGELAADWLDDLVPALDLVFLATLAYRRATRALDPDDPFLSAWHDARRFARSLGEPASRHATLLGARASAPIVRRVCLDPAASIGPVLAGAHAFVGLSGTLAPIELHESELGVDPDRAARIEVRDPFPAECRRLVIDPSIDTTKRARGRQLPAIAARLAGVAQACPGACLALLPSHALVGDVLGALGPLPVAVAAQRPGDDAADRRALLARLEEGKPLLLLAVAGGVLAESIDVRRGALRAVVVVGPCLPAPTPEHRLLEAHYEAQAGTGFAWSMVAPGMARVIQAGGRLVRDPSDRGLLVLLGRRFLRDPYRAAIPEAWLGDRTPEECGGDPVEEALAFFEG